MKITDPLVSVQLLTHIFGFIPHHYVTCLGIESQ